MKEKKVSEKEESELHKLLMSDEDCIHIEEALANQFKKGLKDVEAGKIKRVA